MSLQAVKQAIQTALIAHAGFRVLVPSQQSVLLHAGKFTWEELQARGFNAPAVFINHLGFRQADAAIREDFAEPEKVFSVRFAIGIVTKHLKSKEARNELAAAIAEQLALIIADNTWGLPTVSPYVEQLRGEGIFNFQAESDNQSMWLVTWFQNVQIEETDWSTLDIFEGFDGEHQVGQSQADYPPDP